MLDQASKKLRIDDSGAYTTSSDSNTNGASFNTLRPMGQKAAKRKGKKKVTSSTGLSEKARESYDRKTEAIKELADAERFRHVL